jgi:CRISPR-associated protein Csb1
MNAATLLDRLDGERYLALDVDLQPLGSPTIQPTTFANTGPSFYEAPDGNLAAVVDSVASMANQFELTIWNEAASEPVPPVAPLPWIKVVDAEDNYYTSSRRAAHRLGAHSLINGTEAATGEVMETRLKRLLGQPPAAASTHLAQVVWDHDPLAVIHGCWFAGIWDGRARLTRALSARIDALHVQSQSVQVGGQKTADHIIEVTRRQAGAEGTTVEGEVPHYTAEVSASRIVSPIVLDLGLLRSYGLPEAAYRALVATGVLQIMELIAAWPRRRSRCILDAAGLTVHRPRGLAFPSPDELRHGLLAEFRDECFKRCREATSIDRAEPLVVRWTPKSPKSSGGSQT